MMIEFFKITALGNDFVFIEGKYLIDIVRVCRRKFGIGADGMIFYDYISDNKIKVDFYNSDGSHAKNCGNGLRCAARLMHKEKNIKSGAILTGAGEFSFSIPDDGSVSVNMGEPRLIRTKQDYFEVDVGNLHRIYIKDNYIESEIIEVAGDNPEYNIEFIMKNQDYYRVKVYERGVGFTLGCGTGATAIFAVLREFSDLKRIKLRFDGGPLFLESSGKDIVLTGEANILFKGVLRGTWYT